MKIELYDGGYSIIECYGIAKASPPHKGKGKRIISICANCHYNNMNHVEVTISKKKDLQTYIIVMREDGSLFDIVKKEDRILILNYCIEI